jgi:hypothetical protein
VDPAHPGRWSAVHGLRGRDRHCDGPHPRQCSRPLATRSATGRARRATTLATFRFVTSCGAVFGGLECTPRPKQAPRG